VYKILLEGLKERDHLEDLGVLGRIILKCILGKHWEGRGGADWFIWLKTGTQQQALVNMVMNFQVL
jgi:hypothetical protein